MNLLFGFFSTSRSTKDRIKSLFSTSIKSKTQICSFTQTFCKYQIPPSTNNASLLFHPNLSTRKKLLENFLCEKNFSQNEKTQINYSWMLQRESCQEIKIVRLKSFHFAYIQAFNGLLTFRCLSVPFLTQKSKSKGETTFSLTFL